MGGWMRPPNSRGMDETPPQSTVDFPSLQKCQAGIPVLPSPRQIPAVTVAPLVGNLFTLDAAALSFMEMFIPNI